MSRWTDKADAYVTAYKRVLGVFPSKHNVLLGLSVAQHETACGDAWKDERNWGACTARGLNDEERAKLKAAGVVASPSVLSETQARAVLGSPKGLALHRDSSKALGWYFTWFAAFDNDVDGAAYFIKILAQNRSACRAVLDDPNGTTRQLAEKMYASSYYMGSHAHDTVGNEANIADYTKALNGVMPGIVAGLASWEPPGQPSPVEPPKPSEPVTAFGQRVADIAITHCPCSAHVNQDMYIDVIVRPSDRTPQSKLDYFIGSSPPSTCGLFGCGCLRLAGWEDPEITAPYKIGSPGAVADTQTVGKRHGVLESGTPALPFRTGDIIVITEILYDKDGKPYDNAHEIVCVGDVVVGSDGSWVVDTVQGGQFDSGDPNGGSSTQKRITSTFRLENGKRYAGSRYVVATVRCSRYVEPAVVEPAVTSPTVDTIPAPPETQPDMVTDKEVTSNIRPITGGVATDDSVKPAAASKPAMYGLTAVIVAAVTGIIGYVVYLLGRC